MRNLKKILSLVLAMVMAFSVMAAANAFDDAADIDATYDEAVDVLSNLGVFKGKGTTSTFKPKDDITRAEVAAIIYRIVTGDVNDKSVAIHSEYTKFSDVPANHWAAGYIGYCANAEYIKGYNGKFMPDDKVTGYQALTMILRAVGYDQNGEFTGAGWQVRTAAKATELGLLKNITAGTLGSYATREVVAEILFRTIAEAYVVEYTLGQYQPVALAASANNWYTQIFDTAIPVNAFLTLGQQTFGLQKVEGEITAVGRAAGTTTLITENFLTQNPIVTVTNTTTPWTNIGYGAYVYAVPTAGAKTVKAVSDVVVTGKSLLVSTDGTAFNNLIANETVPNTKGSILVDWEDVNIYYNGVLQLTEANETAALNRADDRGVKVDFIDNDNGGQAEAIVVTEYTPAEVTGITGTTTTGINAVAADRTYFTTRNVTTSVANANVVCADTLAVYDIVTYVDYAGDRYTFKAPYVADTFKQINRTILTDISYQIGTETLYASQLVAPIGALIDADLNKTIGYYVDEFGYIIEAEVVVAADQYLLGVSNNHYEGNNHKAQGYVVLTDGSYPVVDLAKVDGTINFYSNRIEKNLYKYTVGTDGKYTLTSSDTEITSVDYAAGSAAIELNGGNYYVNNKTIFVDVSGILAGTATEAKVYTGHTGDNKIPSMEAAEGWFVNSGSYVSLAFVWDIETYVTDNFYLYDTNPYAVTATATGALRYTYRAVRAGDIAATQLVTVDAVGKTWIDTHGVGYYTVNKAGAIDTYTSYVELMSALAWDEQTIINLANAYGVEAAAYTFDENTTYTVLNVENKTATNFTMNSGVNFDSILTGNTTYGFVVGSGYAKNVYIVVGDVAATTGTPTAYLYNNGTDLTEGGKIYWAADKKITAVELVEAMTYPTDRPTVTLPASETTLNWVTDKMIGGASRIEIPYAVWTAWVEANANFTVTPAVGNTVSLNGAVTFTAEDVKVPVNPGVDGTQTITVLSQGNQVDAEGKVISETKEYNFVINYAADTTGTDLWLTSTATKNDTNNLPLINAYEGAATSFSNLKDWYTSNGYTEDWHFYDGNGDELTEADQVNTNTVDYATVKVTAMNGDSATYVILFGDNADARKVDANNVNGVVAALLENKSLTLAEIANMVWTNNNSVGDQLIIPAMDKAGVALSKIFTDYGKNPDEIVTCLKNGGAGYEEIFNAMAEAKIPAATINTEKVKAAEALLNATKTIAPKAGFGDEKACVAAALQDVLTVNGVHGMTVMTFLTSTHGTYYACVGIFENGQWVVDFNTTHNYQVAAK